MTDFCIENSRAIKISIFVAWLITISIIILMILYAISDELIFNNKAESTQCLIENHTIVNTTCSNNKYLYLCSEGYITLAYPGPDELSTTDTHIRTDFLVLSENNYGHKSIGDLSYQRIVDDLNINYIINSTISCYIYNDQIRMNLYDVSFEVVMFILSLLLVTAIALIPITMVYYSDL